MLTKKPPKPHFRADPTRQKIIDAARQLFVRQGFSGTAIGKIAKLANINHSLIFHHFTNKEGLWLAVKQHIVDEAAKKSPTLPDTNRSFHDFLHTLLTCMINFYRDHPDIVYLINWQRLEASQNHGFYIKNTKEASKWISAFQHYQQQGDISRDLDLAFIITMLSSIVSSASMDPYESISNDKSQAAYIDFCVERLIIAFRPKKKEYQ